VLIGLALGIEVLSLANGGGRQFPPSGAILSECDGHFRSLVIQYEPSAREIVSRPYADFLGALEKDVTVFVVCPSRNTYDELVAFVGPVRCRLQPIVVNHPMTTWSRDRWVALAPASPKGITTLLHQPEEASAEIWPARAGDEKISADIAGALPSSVFARRASFYFDGGDFLADDETVFVAPRGGLHRAWSETTYHMQRLRDNPDCAREEYERLLEMASWHLHQRAMPRAKGAAEVLIEELGAKGIIRTEEKIELIRIWKTRNKVVHPAGSRPAVFRAIASR